MIGIRRLGLAAALVFVLSGAASAADTALAVYKAMGIAAADVLNGTVLSSPVLPGADKQVVALVTYLTGKRDDAGAVNVRLEIFNRDGEALESLYSRDYGKENGGYVGRGELELVDLDGDGASEIVVTYDNAKNRVVDERRGEVLLHEAGGFRSAWSGSMLYDATRAARELPVERRDRFTRKLDPAQTRRTHGASLVFVKTTIAVAGERLAEPKTATEVFPLRPPVEPR